MRPFFLIAFGLAVAASAAQAKPDLERGKYLVAVSGCTTCHTPGALTGEPDMSMYLAGSDVGFGKPGGGVVVGGNLTPDAKTGLGNWAVSQIVKAITTGVLPDGRVMEPAMPWASLAQLKPADAEAIAAYLKSLPPVVNEIEAPFRPGEPPNVYVMTIVPGSIFLSLPKAPR